MLANKYNIIKRISGGSTCDVLLAVDTTKNEEVVVKRMRKGTREHRIKHEIEINEMLLSETGFSHLRDQIETSDEMVCLYFFFQRRSDIKQFLIFDRVRGMDLFEAMESRNFRSLPERVVRYILRGAAQAIQKCHDRQIAHRDVKLENVSLSHLQLSLFTEISVTFPDSFQIMVDFETKTVTLIDFGLSCRFERVKNSEVRVKDFCGSVEYLAPEALTGTSFVATKADSWALGVTAYALLYGEFPYGVEDIVKGRGHPLGPGVESVPLPEDSRVSDEMREKLSKLLMLNPEKRATVAIFADE